MQLADDSNQEFPFRRVAHFLDGAPYAYPVGVARATLRAGRVSADSARSALARLLESESRTPAAFTVNEAGLLAVVGALRAEGHAEAAVAVLRTAASRYQRSCAFAKAMTAAGLEDPARPPAIEPCRH